MKKPVLYVQALSRSKLAYDFCYSAKVGAEQSGINVKPFTNGFDVPGDATNIIVGSVEMCRDWLEATGRDVPEPVNLFKFQDYLGRTLDIVDIKDIKYPCFIKPFTKIKAFTGFVAEAPLYTELFAEGYEGLVLAQDVIELVSEYRMYINCDRIVGMKHYSGDCLIFPEREFIMDCVSFAKQTISRHAYTLDFGVLEDGNTVLIEINDAWAIGNYGLEPLDYYLLCRNRWLQMTGIRNRME